MLVGPWEAGFCGLQELGSVFLRGSREHLSLLQANAPTAMRKLPEIRIWRLLGNFWQNETTQDGKTNIINHPIFGHAPSLVK